MTERVYTQHDRDQLLMALLDITVAQVNEKFASIPDDELSDEINNLFGQYVNQMMSEQVDGQVMFQAIAQMADVTLHRTVQLFGTDPL